MALKLENVLTKAFTDIDGKALDALIERVTEAKEQQEQKENKDKKKRQGKNNKRPGNKVKPEVKQHQLETLNKGDDCPQCDTGKLYKYDPATLLRITGQSPFVPELHAMERLRCNTCGAYFTAELAQEVLDDGGATQKYGYSARTP